MTKKPIDPNDGLIANLDKIVARKEEARKVVRTMAFSTAVLESIPEGGTHTGPLYAALMTYGFDLPTFEKLIDQLVEVEALRRASRNFVVPGPKYAIAIAGMMKVMKTWKDEI